jgi:dihydroorotate dehydrogenase electron transfer subunit
MQGTGATPTMAARRRPGAEAGAGRPMRLLDAELVETREILPRQWLQRYRAPWLATGARAGQFVHVRTPDYSGLVLRRPFSINTVDRVAGEITLHFRTAGKGTELLAHARPGESVPMLGPLGRPFEVDPRTHHVLLIAGGLGIAGLRALIDESLAAGRQVTLLFGAASAAEVYPSSLLPDEVEYVVATEDGSLGQAGRVTDLVPAYEAWADQAFACGPHPMLATLAALARGRQARMGVARLGRKRGGGKPVPLGSPQARRRAWLQVALEQHMGCAVGACLGCVVWGIEGPVRVCREGPVFAADEIAWEEAV